MSSQTFFLELKNGRLVIPSEAMEYLNQCQGEIKVSQYTARDGQCLRLTRIPRVSLTIQSTDAKTVILSTLDEKGERDFQTAWNRWLAEVDQLEPSS